MKAIMNTGDFNRLIDATKQFCARNDTRPIYEWIRLEFSRETVTAIAVDGYRISIERATCSDLDEPFVAYIKPTIKKFKKDWLVTIELMDKKLYLHCMDEITGFAQPEGDFLDWKKSYEDITAQAPGYKIAFNSNYTLCAMQSLKASAIDTLRRPVIFELRSPTEPVIMRIGNRGERIVLPVRSKETDL